MKMKLAREDIKNNTQVPTTDDVSDDGCEVDIGVELILADKEAFSLRTGVEACI
jgi:hypothetical protein